MKTFVIAGIIGVILTATGCGSVDIIKPDQKGDFTGSWSVVSPFVCESDDYDAEQMNRMESEVEQYLYENELDFEDPMWTKVGNRIYSEEFNQRLPFFGIDSRGRYFGEMISPNEIDMQMNYRISAPSRNGHVTCTFRLARR